MTDAVLKSRIKSLGRLELLEWLNEYLETDYLKVRLLTVVELAAALWLPNVFVLDRALCHGDRVCHRMSSHLARHQMFSF